jgi:hypothetical protein
MRRGIKQQARGRGSSPPTLAKSYADYESTIEGSKCFATPKGAVGARPRSQNVLERGRDEGGECEEEMRVVSGRRWGGGVLMYGGCRVVVD